MIELELQQVLRSAREGNQEAYAELIRRFGDAMYRLAYRLLRDHGEAEDACQEAFLRAFTKLDTYDSRYSLYTWLSAILTNLCYRTLQRRDWRSVSVDPFLLREAPCFAEESPEAVLLASERAEGIWKALDRLPDAYRQMIILRHWHELSYQEIAEVTRQSLATVKTRLHRGRHMLASQFVDRQVLGGIA